MSPERPTRTTGPNNPFYIVDGVWIKRSSTNSDQSVLSPPYYKDTIQFSYIPFLISVGKKSLVDLMKSPEFLYKIEVNLIYYRRSY